MKLKAKKITKNLLNEIDFYKYYIVTMEGKIWSKINKKFLKLQNIKDSGTRARIRINKINYFFSVSRLVAATYMGLNNENLIVFHKNNNPFDNNFDNLMLIDCKDPSKCGKIIYYLRKFSVFN